MFSAATKAVNAPTTQTLTFLQSANSVSSSATYTFTSQNIGTASSDRYIVIAITGGNGSTTNITGVTIGGNAMTKENGNASAAGTVSAIYRLLVTTGTSATVVVTFSSAVTLFCCINMYALTGFGTISAPYSTFTTTTAVSNVVSGTLNNTAGGAAIMIAGRFQATAPTVTAFAGCTVADTNVAINISNRTWCGHLAPTTLATSKTFSVTFSGGSTLSATAVAY